MTRDMPNDEPSQSGQPPEASLIYRVLSHVGVGLGYSVEKVRLSQRDNDQEPLEDCFDELIASANQSGITLREVDTRDAREIIAFVREGFPVIIVDDQNQFLVLERMSGRRVQAVDVGPLSEPRYLTGPSLATRLQIRANSRIFVAKKQLECDSISSQPITHHDDDHAHAHPTPLRRFLGLLNLDRRDIWMVVLFAFVSGILALATPLAIESLVNVVSWGTYFQPLLVLSVMLITCLGMAGVLKVLQTVVVEIIQRRQFVRIVSDLAHRFPRANQESLTKEFPRELANRVFDVMTIQKATAILLMDGVSIVLTTMVGLTLLAFYHPFLLGFDIVLVLTMISITWILGRGGVRTAIDESITKYRVAHWLQDVLASPATFKINGGEALAIQRANQLTADYVKARQRQFRVVIRQIVFAIGLQIVASTVVLGFGGYLVIQGQLTLGQLVASELVVTVVVGAFAKAGKSLEKFYDLMAGVDKVGHLLDVPADRRLNALEIPTGPAGVRWSDMVFRHATSTSKISASQIPAGAVTALVGNDLAGRHSLARAIAGLESADQGQAEIAGYDALHAASASKGRLVSYAGSDEIFNGTIEENVDLGRARIGQNRVRESLQQVGLWSALLKLPDGVKTRLQTDGFPLTPPQKLLLVIAQAIAAGPKLLIVDRLLDELGEDDRRVVWECLTKDDAPWTLIVSTNRDDVAAGCELQIGIRQNETG